MVSELPLLSNKDFIKIEHQLIEFSHVNRKLIASPLLIQNTKKAFIQGHITIYTLYKKKQQLIKIKSLRRRLHIPFIS